MARLFKSHIQGSFGAANHKNFEAVILENRDLWHWWRDNSAEGQPWKRGQRIIQDRAAFPASLIQSDFRNGQHGNFEVVVPLFNDHGIAELWHMWHDNSDVNNHWSFGQRITEEGREVRGPASIIQSDFGNDNHGNFEVIVPIVNDTGQIELRHYWHNNSDVDNPWQKAQVINDPTDQILGGGCLIQSNFKSDEHGNFEVVAPIRLPDGRTVLQHYWHDNSNVNLPWKKGHLIIEGVKGNGIIIQSNFGFPHGNFEVVVPVSGPGGRTYLQHVWHDNSNVALPWQRGQVISEVGASGSSVSFFQSSYPLGERGNFELLMDECPNSLVEYWHPNRDVNLPWIKTRILLGEPAPGEIPDTERICQLTGEYDLTGWDGLSPRSPAFNQTESKSGIRGTDLGVSFEHKGKLWFLFGDTWRMGDTASNHSDLDAIAFCADKRVQGGLKLTFNNTPPLVSGTSQAGFEVPLDGFSYNDEMICFFSTDHSTIDGVSFMGRSLMAISQDDGYKFLPYLNFSRNKFINVSIEYAKLNADQAHAIGWPKGKEVLWVWGSGRYRQSPPYLAVIDIGKTLDAVFRRFRKGSLVEIHDFNPDSKSVLFYTGHGETVSWSIYENDAVPLFCSGDIGELSGRFNKIFNRYFLTYNTANPRGIMLRTSPQPWGPWSSARKIFNPDRGYGDFMHISYANGIHDHVQDNMFLGGIRDNESGGEYGPYQITRFTAGESDKTCDLYYTMSTWNPYQSMLMRTRIELADIL